MFMQKLGRPSFGGGLGIGQRRDEMICSTFRPDGVFLFVLLLNENLYGYKYHILQFE